MPTLTNPTPTIPEITAIPSIPVSSWVDGAYTYAIAIKQSQTRGGTPTTKTNAGVWQISRLTTADNSVTFPVVSGNLVTTFSLPVSTLASDTLANVKTYVEGLTYWELS